jgi:5'-AMP-activated protein kinase, catalytic alpha subunit
MPSDGSKLHAFCGTPSYMCPQILGGHGYCGLAADAWALGVILFVLVCGRFPFKAQGHQELYRKIRRGNFVISDHVSPPASRVIKSLMTMQEEK